MPAGPRWISPELCPEAQDGVEIPSTFFGTPWTPTYLYYHSIVGGVRLRQEKIDPMEECPVSEVGASLHTGHCVWGEYWLEPELQRGLHTNHYLVDKPGGETVFLLSLTSQADVRRKLRELENQAWFSPWTSKV